MKPKQEYEDKVTVGKKTYTTTVIERGAKWEVYAWVNEQTLLGGGDSLEEAIKSIQAIIARHV